jgi:hypothetical protein
MQRIQRTELPKRIASFSLEIKDTADSILVFTESSMPSGIFLKKMPPCTIFK